RDPVPAVRRAPETAQRSVGVTSVSGPGRTVGRRPPTLQAIKMGPGQASTREPEARRLRRWDVVSAAVALGLAIVLMALFAAIAPEFRSLSGGLSLGAAWWFYTLLALGLTLVMTTGRMDVSGASVAALAGAVAVKLAV